MTAVTVQRRLGLESTEGHAQPADARDLRACPWSGVLRGLGRRARLAPRCLAWAGKLEGGQFYSATMRAIMRDEYGVNIGAYSYGGCFVPGAFPAGVTLGRFVSVAYGVRAFVRDHPLDRLSMHPFFYNAALGVVPQDTIESGTLEVGHDAWIGESVMITSGCTRIGIGAVVGAGAVVTRDVPDFAVVVGNPARVIRTRFPEAVCEVVLASRWWERSVAECRAVVDAMVRPIASKAWDHPLLKDYTESAAAGRK